MMKFLPSVLGIWNHLVKVESWLFWGHLIPLLKWRASFGLVVVLEKIKLLFHTCSNPLQTLNNDS